MLAPVVSHGVGMVASMSGLARNRDGAADGSGLFIVDNSVDGHWQRLEKVRILMGDEVSLRTKQAFSEALSDRLGRLDGSLEAEKGPNPFLAGVDGIVEALKSGQIECRVFRTSKFHAKAYITHSKIDVVGARALVGSSSRLGVCEPPEFVTNPGIDLGRPLGTQPIRVLRSD